jgi:HAE1 family hydrophobic/amphiphilic exporter-1
MFVEFFIRRPVFATVCSIIIVLAGLITLPTLPVAQYPSLAPPQVTATANYTGANSEQVESAVTTTLEKEINGIKGLKYIQSQSSNDGQSKITATFDLERASDLAAVDVQTKVSAAEGRLPDEAKRLGVSIEKVSTSIVDVIALWSESPEYDAAYISNYADIYLKDELKSIKGVGDVSIIGERKYAMRIWLDPGKLAQYRMSPLEVQNALTEQNKQVGAGDLGGPPAVRGQAFQYNVSAKGRLTNPTEFSKLIVKRGDNGALVHLSDIGKVDLGAESYVNNCSYRGKECVGLLVYLRQGGNALEVSRGVKEILNRFIKRLPPGMKCEISVDTTEAVDESIKEVEHTLLEAILLVVLVIFFFLQDWRSMVIACITVPVSLVGTLAVMKLLGFSINTLTLFGLTLATGLVVDDAIIVVENVQRHMHSSKISAFDATILAMREIWGALIATALVLVAVFVPVAFFPGTTGQLYKQFALTIAVSISLSAFNALTLSPALSALILKQAGEKQTGLFGLINRFIDSVRSTYEKTLALVLGHVPIALIAMVAAVCAALWLVKILPTGFVPQEDQGWYLVMIRAPEGASLEYTTKATAKAADIVSSLPEARPALFSAGYSFNGNASNLGLIFCPLKHWRERPGHEHVLDNVIAKAQARLSQISDATVVAFNPPALEGIGNFGGFVYELRDLYGREPRFLAEVANDLIQKGNRTKELQGLFTTFTANTPQLKLKVRRDVAEQMNVNVGDVLDTLQVLSGSSYVNDFDYLNRSYRVYLQAQKEFRTNPRNLFEYYVRSRTGDMVSLDNLLDFEINFTAPIINHYDLFRSVEINGNPAPGYSSGQAVEAMERLSRSLPQGMSFKWSGISLEEIQAGSSAILMFGLGLVFVFLVLAAQYESYADPAIILLSVPPAVFGAVLFQWLRGLQNDVFCQIGLVMLVGLASKNAILITEFANELVKKEGLSFKDAALKAAGLRLRPILMTSLAFIAGLMPLVFADGAGANSRQSLGTAVCGGMLVSTVMCLFFVPVVFLVVKSIQQNIQTSFQKRGTSPSSGNSTEIP